MPLVDQYGRPLSARSARLKKGRKKAPKRVKRSHAAEIPEDKLRAQEAAERAKPREVILLAKHTINGVGYGPGRVTVPGPIATVLLENDQRAQQADRDFTGSKACMIGPQNRVTRVAPEFFDAPELLGVPLTVVDKGGMAQY